MPRSPASFCSRLGCRGLQASARRRRSRRREARRRRRRRKWCFRCSAESRMPLGLCLPQTGGAWLALPPAPKAPERHPPVACLLSRRQRRGLLSRGRFSSPRPVQSKQQQPAHVGILRRPGPGSSRCPCKHALASERSPAATPVQTLLANGLASCVASERLPFAFPGGRRRFGLLEVGEAEKGLCAAAARGKEWKRFGRDCRPRAAPAPLSYQWYSPWLSLSPFHGASNVARRGRFMYSSCRTPRVTREG